MMIMVMNRHIHAMIYMDSHNGENYNRDCHNGNYDDKVSYDDENSDGSYDGDEDDNLHNSNCKDEDNTHNTPYSNIRRTKHTNIHIEKISTKTTVELLARDDSHTLPTHNGITRKISEGLHEDVEA